jgi:hypothetical protein
MAYVTGGEVLTQVGATSPDADETAWAGLVAGAIESAIAVRLNGAVIVDPSPAFTEIKVAALIAAQEAYKRKEAVFGVTGFADLQGAAIRVARDYMDGVRPILDRYRLGAGGGIG